LIGLNGVPELAYIRADGSGVAIGAMTRQRTVEHSSVVREQCPLLPTAIEWIGHPQIRNRGTIGGSLVHSDPASELPALAQVMDASFTITHASGSKRTLNADKFFVTFLTTALEPDEMLSEVYFPKLPSSTGWSFLEVARRHGDFALVGAATAVMLDENGVCSNARVALFGVAPTATRSPSAEQALLHQKPDEQTIAAASSEVVKDIDPPDDVHASNEYRKFVATNLVRRALTEAVQRAQ
jgi:aerobic carbon-monoxide dehydrogenase medium subunit